MGESTQKVLYAIITAQAMSFKRGDQAFELLLR